MPEQIGLQAVFETAQFQAGLNQYINGLNQAKGATSGAAGAASSAGSIISTGLAVAFGNVLYQAVGAATQALGNFITQSIQSVGELQRLDIMLESLAARQLMLAGMADNMTDALAQAGPVADALLASLQELSLVSPFEYTDVVNTFRLNMAFGASADSALQMTQAILDMAAAMGLTGPFLERIVYNFSQMQQIGKISARDIRDLAMAGVDLAAVLREQLGMSIDEVNAALEAGTISMQDVTNAFIEFSKANFGGAAERMSMTLDGLKSSFADLSFFAAQDLFGPLVEKITVDLQGLFQSARQLLDSGALQGVGQALASVYDMLKQVPGAATEVGQAISSIFGDNISGVVEDAFNWGVNLIANFSQGIITGIADFLVSAMNYLTEVLSYWLSPGSPPRVAPDIDQWGAAAMNEYLNGFTDADFSALDSLQNALSDAFNALGLEDTQGILANLSEQFAQALAGNGTLGQSFFDQLAAAGGQYGDELVRLAKLSLDLANATEQVAQSQKYVDAAAKAERDAREKSNALVNEYNDMLKSGATQDQLDAKLKEINAQEELVAKAAEEKKAAEKRLEDQKAIVANLQEQVDLVQKLIDELTQLYAKQKQPTTPGATTPGGPGGPGGGPGGVGGLLPDPTQFQAGLQNLLNQASQQVQTASNQMWQALVDRLATAFQPITDAWNNTIVTKLEELRARFYLFTNTLITDWTFFTTRMRQDFDPVVTWWNETWPMMQAVFVGAWEQIQAVFDAAIASIEPALNALDGVIKSLDIDGTSLAAVFVLIGQVLSAIVAVGAQLVVQGFTAMAAILSGVITGLATAMVVGQTFVNALNDGITLFIQSVSGEFKAVIDLITSVLKGDLEGIKNAFIDLADAIQGQFLGALQALAAGLAGPIATILGLIAGFVDGVIRFFINMSDELVGHSIIPDMLEDLVDVVTDGFDDLLDTIENFVASTQDGFQDWIDTLTNTIRDGLASVQSIISAQYTNLYNYGRTIITKISDGIKSASSTIANAIKDAVNQAIAGIQGDTGAFYDLGVALVDNITQGVQDGAQGISDAVNQALQLAEIKGYTWTDDFFLLGYKLMQALGDGIESGTDAILEEVGANMQRIVDEMESKIPEATAAASVVSAAQSASRYTQSFAPVPAQTVINNTNASRSVNVPINGVTIRNGMDMAQFEYFIRRVVRSEMGI